jgi:virulence-associated protein VagC
MLFVPIDDEPDRDDEDGGLAEAREELARGEGITTEGLERELDGPPGIECPAVLPWGRRVLREPRKTMPDKARIISTEHGQAERLPAGYRFEGEKEVVISRQGRRIVLEPEQREWSPRFLALAGSAPDFPVPEEPPLEN